MNNVTCDNFFDRYPLDFIEAVQDSDKSQIFQSVRHFKNPNYKTNTVRFLDGRDLNIITEFFSRYGELIR